MSTKTKTIELTVEEIMHAKILFQAALRIPPKSNAQGIHQKIIERIIVKINNTGWKEEV